MTTSGQQPTLFLCGDVMTGRGIDQALPHPGGAELYEPCVRDARDYLALAERRNGPLPRPCRFDYPWGAALPELARRRPRLRLINLETSITEQATPWPGKGIHYRMHPANTPVLTAAGIDAAVLSNNHVLDWGYGGLTETLHSLRKAGIASVGAGADRRGATAPLALPLEPGRLLVFACGTQDSGIPAAWAATADTPGVALQGELSAAAARRLAADIRAQRRPEDRVLLSIHWGGNWGYEVPAAHRAFAHALIDEAAVDVIHGHSSHHPRPIEVYRGRPILYGCGDFINDYEGIGGYEAFRPELTLMYFLDLNPADGALRELRMMPLRMRRFRLEPAQPEAARWLATTLTRHARGCRYRLDADGDLVLEWPA